MRTILVATKESKRNVGCGGDEDAKVTKTKDTRDFDRSLATDLQPKREIAKNAERRRTVTVAPIEGGIHTDFQNKRPPSRRKKGKKMTRL